MIMKELSTEQKAKRYDEALEIARKINSGEGVAAPSDWTTCEAIFPELKESEDERIRKTISDILLIDSDEIREILDANNVLMQDIDNWLEKQGKKLPAGFYYVNKEGKKFYSDTFKYGDVTLHVKKQGEPLEINPTKFDTRLQALIGKFDSLPKEELIGSLSFWLNVIQNDGTYKPSKKQGEQKPFDYENANIQQKDFAPKDYNSIDPHFGKPIDKVEPKFKVGDTVRAKTMNDFVFTIKDITDKQYVDTNGGKFDIEGQNYLELVEQKPNDKVESKFHEGDWITNGDYTWKIVEVKPLDYILQSQDGNIVDDTILHVDEQFHSFTIKDAKDGDVLCTYECGKPKIVFILKGTPKKHYALSYHCYYNIMYPHFETDSEKGCLAPKDEDVKPATKEQRDTLEKAMADAGYTFDFEKKELKKIEQKPTEWSEEDDNCLSTIIAEFSKCAGKSVSKDEWMRCNDFLNSLKDRVHPQQEWSEEDEQMLKVIESDVLRTWQKCEVGTDERFIRSKVLNWLKSLKNRVQPQQEWSEENSPYYDDICEILINLLYSETVGINKDAVQKDLDWLKSLQSHKQWKPSEEQLKSLKGIIDVGHFTSYPNALETLYEQPKQL